MLKIIAKEVNINLSLISEYNSEQIHQSLKQ